MLWKSKSTIWIGTGINFWMSAGLQIRSTVNNILENQTDLSSLRESVAFQKRIQNTLVLFSINRSSLKNICEPIPGISDHGRIQYIAVTRQDRLNSIIDPQTKLGSLTYTTNHRNKNVNGRSNLTYNWCIGISNKICV